MSEASVPTESTVQGDVVARAGNWYRNARYILSAGLILYGLWSIKDGFFTWPAKNAVDITIYGTPEHSEADLLFNQVLGIALPPGGTLFLLWVLRRSRGEIRLSGRTLSIPGHPPIPLDKIESVDRQKWDRKGVAIVTYKLNSGLEGKFLLDDFVYDRAPIDTIFERIEHALKEPRAPQAAPTQAPPPPAAAASPAAAPPQTVAPVPRRNFPTPPPPRPRLGR